MDTRPPTTIRRKPANGSTRSTACSRAEGPDRAHFLIEQLIDKARRSGAYLPFSANTAYINTIPVDAAGPAPRRLRRSSSGSATTCAGTRWRWSLRANKDTNVGGHIASFASAATLYDVGFNHFWHAPSDEHGGDLVFVQGHSAPGVYARAFMLGRLTEDAARQLPAGSRRQGHLVVPASVADAGLLAVPDGVDGPRAADGDLPGAVHEVPAGPRPRADRGPQGLGVHGRRRDGRARVDGRDRHGRRARTSTT